MPYGPHANERLDRRSGYVVPQADINEGLVPAEDRGRGRISPVPACDREAIESAILSERRRRLRICGRTHENGNCEGVSSDVPERWSMRIFPA